VDSTGAPVFEDVLKIMLSGRLLGSEISAVGQKVSISIAIYSIAGRAYFVRAKRLFIFQ
jgi:hypothetical protein